MAGTYWESNGKFDILLSIGADGSLPDCGTGDNPLFVTIGGIIESFTGITPIVLVQFPDGLYYDAAPTCIAAPDACPFDHLHCGPVNSIDGDVINFADPNPPGCGYCTLNSGGPSDCRFVGGWEYNGFNISTEVFNGSRRFVRMQLQQNAPKGGLYSNFHD